MDRGAAGPAADRQRLPRESGDGPEKATLVIGTEQAAPRERGWTLQKLGAARGARGCPARAGMDPWRFSGFRSEPWLPRESGDGPQSWSAMSRVYPAAPRERGWTLAEAKTEAHKAGCPARAGMDPQVWTFTRSARWLPRESGDGPAVEIPSLTDYSAAPRERGWTPREGQHGAMQRGCPARAGMDPFAFSAQRACARLPRESGDGPHRRRDCATNDPAAPRERGWTLVSGTPVETATGCPARAGMDPLDLDEAVRVSGLPRESGDGPRAEARKLGDRRAAPRERGWTPPPYAGDVSGDGCPARAGMDPGRWALRLTWPWLPRESGDGPGAAVHAHTPKQAAPRERGWTLFSGDIKDISDGCPARAGMDPSGRCRPCPGPWLPRESGDGPHARPQDAQAHLAAPRERGWTPGGRVGAAAAGGCPARAGMDPRPVPAVAHLHGLPRESGDGPQDRCRSYPVRVAAPRERGWTQADCGGVVGVVGCPARAGMDPTSTSTAKALKGLPRESGDGPVAAFLAMIRKAAAPRERGWTLRSLAAPAQPEGCPARAGMDPSRPSWP